jgi:hypothetical protein
MDELEISGRRYISSKRAAKENRYHVDYIGQLIRGGKILGSKVGRTWYVEEKSLAEYLGKELAKETPIQQPKNYQPVLQKSESTKAFKKETITPTIDEPADDAIPLRYVSDDAPLEAFAPHKAPEQNWETIEQESALHIHTNATIVPAHSSRRIAIALVIILGFVAFGATLGASYFIGYTNTVENGTTTATVGLLTR